MKTFEDRRKIKKGFYSKPVLLILIVLALVLGRAVWYGFWGRQIAGSNLSMATLEREEIRQRISSLEKDIEELSTERGREEAFRTKLGMVKEGEGVIVLVEPETPEKTEVSSRRGWWHRTKEFLGF